MINNIKRFIKAYKKSIQTAWIAATLGLLYACIIKFTRFRIPCIFQKITGLACPGCGISHFFMNLLKLDFEAAAKENFALAVLSPIWIIAILIRMLWNPRWFCRHGRVENILLWSSIVFLIGFGILRNFPDASFLLPSYMRYSKCYYIIY